MDAAIEDDKKTFSAEHGDDEDAQPDPDEHLMLEQGHGRVWLVKVRSNSSQYNQQSYPTHPPDPQIPYGTLVHHRRRRRPPR